MSQPTSDLPALDEMLSAALASPIGKRAPRPPRDVQWAMASARRAQKNGSSIHRQLDQSAGADDEVIVRIRLRRPNGLVRSVVVAMPLGVHGRLSLGRNFDGNSPVIRACVTAKMSWPEVLYFMNRRGWRLIGAEPVQQSSYPAA